MEATLHLKRKWEQQGQIQDEATEFTKRRKDDAQNEKAEEVGQYANPEDSWCFHYLSPLSNLCNFHTRAPIDASFAATRSSFLPLRSYSSIDECSSSSESQESPPMQLIEELKKRGKELSTITNSRQHPNPPSLPHLRRRQRFAFVDASSLSFTLCVLYSSPSWKGLGVVS
ncbi:hypothetical protein PIB30_074388 [Stylosanthes scabra]|uniref:Uncharacterized protein n=1 Tax=Stylosanthes scabra TaxID=79078 RepID=A0ABU6XMK7_9FABA|nr:hypothetical protein [Stylosanthes scabra]